MGILNRITASLTLLFIPALLHGQLPTLEVHGGVAHVSQPLIQASDGTVFGDGGGVGVGVMFGFPVYQGVELTAGYTRQQFGCSERCTLEGSGVEFGVRGNLPVTRWISAWGGGGILLHRVVLRDNPPRAEDLWWSVHRTNSGQFLEGGLAFYLGNQLSLRPGVRAHRYHARARPMDQDGIPGAEEGHDILYPSFRLALRFTP
jgi:hypothetical protein